MTGFNEGKISPEIAKIQAERADLQGIKRKLVLDVLGHYAENQFIKAVVTRIIPQESSPVRLDASQIEKLDSLLKPCLQLNGLSPEFSTKATEIAAWISDQFKRADVPDDDPVAKEQRKPSITL